MLRKSMIVAGVIGLALLIVAPARAADADAVAGIKAAFDNLKSAFLRQDGATVKAIMTEDGILAMPFYRAALSANEVASTLSELKVRNHDSHDLKVTMLGPDTGVITLYTSFDGTYKDTPLPPWVFASGLWVKQDGAWRLKLYQETTVDGPPSSQ
jgi:ketosteroid isomerase-like protein